jgi:hypothetical protein
MRKHCPGTEMARELSRRVAIRRSGKDYVPSYSLALIFIGLGDRTQAVEWFAKSYQDRSTYMVYAKVDFPPCCIG